MFSILFSVFSQIGFMVCSIRGASVFVPTMFSLGVVGSVIVSNNVAYQFTNVK